MSPSSTRMGVLCLGWDRVGVGVSGLQGIHELVCRWAFFWANSSQLSSVLQRGPRPLNIKTYHSRNVPSSRQLWSENQLLTPDHRSLGLHQGRSQKGPRFLHSMPLTCPNTTPRRAFLKTNVQFKEVSLSVSFTGSNAMKERELGLWCLYFDLYVPQHNKSSKNKKANLQGLIAEEESCLTSFYQGWAQEMLINRQILCNGFLHLTFLFFFFSGIGALEDSRKKAFHIKEARNVHIHMRAHTHIEKANLKLY